MLVGLLQHPVGRITQDCHRQAAASHERCSTSHERHTEVRPQFDTAPSCWAALARCGRSGHVQARLDGIKVSSRPDYLSELCMPFAQVAERQRLRLASPQLARRHKVPAEHVWSSCLCRGCAGNGNLEYTVGWTAKPGSPQCHLTTQLEDVSVSTILGALSALETLCDYALYKSTFTLHYKCLHLGFHWSYDDGGGSDNWSYKICKVSVKTSPSTHQHPAFHRPDALLVTQPSIRALKGKHAHTHKLIKH